VIRCHDCGKPIVRWSHSLECACRVGFVAQWDVCVGLGQFLGRIINGLSKNDNAEVIS